MGISCVSGDENVVGNRVEGVGDGHEERKKWKVGSQEISYRRDDMELKSPWDKEGLISDMPVFQGLLDHAFDTRLMCNVREHPVLLVEPSWNTTGVRESMTQVMFESYNTPGLFISKSAVLATFMNAKSSGVVLDCGHGWSSAVPVHDGYVLHKCIQKSPVAGARLQQDLLAYWNAEHKQTLHPQYECKRGGNGDIVTEFPKTHASYRAYMVDEVLRDMKESTCRVSDVDYSEAVYDKMPGVPYQLPDGKIIQMGAQRFKTPELLFKPDLYSPVLEAGVEKTKGVHELVYGAIQLVDSDLRRDMWSNICLAGGTTLMQGFKERVERDLSNIAPMKMKVTASNYPVERRFSSWIGGSILASLGTFQQMWISKAEYDENGSSICSRKCP